MKLKEWDFDKQKFVLHEYPDAPVAEFVDFFRTTKAWEEDPDRIKRRVLQMEKALAEHRQKVAAVSRVNGPTIPAAAQGAATAVPKPTIPAAPGGPNVQVA